MAMGVLAAVSLVLAPAQSGLRLAPAGSRQLASPERLMNGFLHDWLNLNDEAAVANFSAHLAWSTALPLLGEKIDGRRGKWIAGGLWIGYSLVNELALHGQTGAPELRADLLSRLTPAATLLLLDLVFGGK